jgi:hypothetical protein
LSDIEKNLGNALARFGDLSKKGFDKAKETIIHSSHTVKAKIDITGLKREKKRFLEELGGELIEAISSGSLKTKLFSESISNIGDIDLKIQEKETELESVGEKSPASEEQQTEKPEEKEKPESN